MSDLKLHPLELHGMWHAAKMQRDEDPVVWFAKAIVKNQCYREERQDRRNARRTQPDTVDGDPVGDLQAESRQEKLDDFIASMKTQPEATAPAQAAKTVPVLNDRGKFHPYDTRISTATVFTEITVPCDRATDFDRELAAFEAWFALDPTDYSLKEIIKRGWFARGALASSANALSAGDSEVFREFFRASMEWSDIAGREEINLEEDRKAEARYEDALKKAMKANNAILQSQKGGSHG